MKTPDLKGLSAANTRSVEDFFLRRRIFHSDDYAERFRRSLWVQRLRQRI